MNPSRTNGTGRHHQRSGDDDTPRLSASIPSHRERDERAVANHSGPEIAGRQLGHRLAGDATTPGQGFPEGHAPAVETAKRQSVSSFRLSKEVHLLVTPTSGRSQPAKNSGGHFRIFGTRPKQGHFCGRESRGRWRRWRQQQEFLRAQSTWNWISKFSSTAASACCTRATLLTTN